MTNVRSDESELQSIGMDWVSFAASEIMFLVLIHWFSPFFLISQGQWQLKLKELQIAAAETQKRKISERQSQRIDSQKKGREEGSCKRDRVKWIENSEAEEEGQGEGREKRIEQKQTEKE